MTNFIDLIYCSGLDGGQVIACAPMSACIRKGDLVCIDGRTDFYMVTCQATVAKASDTYKFITEVFGNLDKVTDKYSHNEIGDRDYE